MSRKKKAAVEQLHQVREELSRTEAECEEKRGHLQQTGAGEEVLKGDEVFNDLLIYFLSDYIVNCVGQFFTAQHFWTVRQWAFLSVMTHEAL